MKIINLILACGFLTGCAAMMPQRRAQPTVSIVNMHVNDMTVFESGVRLTVRIDNASPEPMLVNGAVHHVAVNGLIIGKALDSGRFEVPRLGSVTREMRMNISNMNTLAQLQAHIDSGKVSYKMVSTLYGKNQFLDLQLVKEETIDLSQPIGIPGGPRATGRRFDPDEFRLADPESIPEGTVAPDYQPE